MITTLTSANTVTLTRGRGRFSNYSATIDGKRVNNPKIVINAKMTYENVAVGPATLGNFQLEDGKASIGITVDDENSLAIMRVIEQRSQGHVDSLNLAEFKPMLVGDSKNEVRFMYDPARQNKINFNDKKIGCVVTEPKNQLTGAEIAPLLKKGVPVRVVARLLWMCHSRSSTTKLQIRKIFITGEAAEDEQANESDDEWAAMLE